MELDGAHARLVVTDLRSAFYIRLSDFDVLDMIKLRPKKSGRVVEDVSILQFKDYRVVNETRNKVESFKKQEADLLYRIWPQKPLEPGEYALIQYADGKLNPQIWDFTIDAK